MCWELMISVISLYKEEKEWDPRAEYCQMTFKEKKCRTGKPNMLD